MNRAERKDQRCCCLWSLLLVGKKLLFQELSVAQALQLSKALIIDLEDEHGFLHWIAGLRIERDIPAHALDSPRAIDSSQRLLEIGCCQVCFPSGQGIFGSSEHGEHRIIGEHDI